MMGLGLMAGVVLVCTRSAGTSPEVAFEALSLMANAQGIVSEAVLRSAPNRPERHLSIKSCEAGTWGLRVIASASATAQQKRDEIELVIPAVPFKDEMLPGAVVMDPLHQANEAEVDCLGKAAIVCPRL